MNIFLVDKNPRICAESLCDLRLNKMILETTQMLCTVYPSYWPALSKANSDKLYKATHMNHPCTAWARRDIHNYCWLIIYLNELHNEYTYRRDRTHKCRGLFPMLMKPVQDKVQPYIEEPVLQYKLTGDLNIRFTFNCSNIHPNTGNVFDDYKVCLSIKWHNDSRVPKWSFKAEPLWRINQPELSKYSYLN